jgi:hypothetical protein
MKKILMILSIIVVLMLTGCDWKTKVDKDSTLLTSAPLYGLTFSNGAALWSFSDGSTVEIFIQTNKKVVGADMSFYYYIITEPDGNVTYIADSESLAIRFSLNQPVWPHQ